MNSQSTQHKRSGSQGTTSHSQDAQGSVEPVVIELRGKRLAIRTSHDAEFVQQLAGYVDEKMKQIQQAAPSAPFDKLLMLVSLNLAEELFAMQNSVDHIKGQVDTKADDLLALIDSHAASLIGSTEH